MYPTKAIQGTRGNPYRNTGCTLRGMYRWDIPGPLAGLTRTLVGIPVEKKQEGVPARFHGPPGGRRTPKEVNTAIWALSFIRAVRRLSGEHLM